MRDNIYSITEAEEYICQYFVASILNWTKLFKLNAIRLVSVKSDISGFGIEFNQKSYSGWLIKK